MNQFAQGINDRLVRSDVKRYIAQHGISNICSMDVLEAASEVEKDHAVEEKYAHTYRERIEFLNKRVEEKSSKLKVSNINPQSQRTEHSTPNDKPYRTHRNYDEPSQRPDHSTPKEIEFRGHRNNDDQRPSNNYREKQAEYKKNQMSQVVCYRCQQPGQSRKVVEIRG